MIRMLASMFSVKGKYVFNKERVTKLHNIEGRWVILDLSMEIEITSLGNGLWNGVVIAAVHEIVTLGVTVLTEIRRASFGYSARLYDYKVNRIVDAQTALKEDYIYIKYEGEVIVMRRT
ncbi:hypothetical protein [Pleionea sediminis]|uniref:hypothetical protein n=1 Tax=Pleionea sediminis TaxID=2569479 RepID=UPI001186D883|nr:hypothetical protein [Pleionea sediminis]